LHRKILSSEWLDTSYVEQLEVGFLESATVVISSQIWWLGLYVSILGAMRGLRPHPGMTGFRISCCFVDVRDFLVFLVLRCGAICMEIEGRWICGRPWMSGWLANEIYILSTSSRSPATLLVLSVRRMFRYKANIQCSQKAESKAGTVGVEVTRQPFLLHVDLGKNDRHYLREHT